MSEENDSGVDAGSDSNLSVSMSVGSSQGSDDEPVENNPNLRNNQGINDLNHFNNTLPPPQQALRAGPSNAQHLHSAEGSLPMVSNNVPINLANSATLDLRPIPSTSAILNIPVAPYSASMAFPPPDLNSHVYRNKIKANILSRSKGKRHESSSSNLMNEKKLRIAANLGDLQAVEKLLDEGVNPRSSDNRGRTALHFAACKGDIQMATLLLSHGANPNQQDVVGNTPLHLAACTNHTAMITLLLRYGTDVHALDRCGRTPIQLAQSKLRLLQESKLRSSEELKEEILQVIEMMMEYSRRSGKPDAANLFAHFSSRIHEQNTKGEMNKALEDILSSLSHLTLSQPSKNGHNSRDM